MKKFLLLLGGISSAAILPLSMIACNNEQKPSDDNKKWDNDGQKNPADSAGSTNGGSNQEIDKPANQNPGNSNGSANGGNNQESPSTNGSGQEAPVDNINEKVQNKAEMLKFANDLETELFSNQDEKWQKAWDEVYPLNPDKHFPASNVEFIINHLKTIWDKIAPYEKTNPSWFKNFSYEYTFDEFHDKKLINDFLYSIAKNSTITQVLQSGPDLEGDLANFTKTELTGPDLLTLYLVDWTAIKSIQDHNKVDEK
ncbi:hypothetical protein [Mycoplasma seminis]|uniref:Variable surface lipoprotein n=1 Tax=Mycoplasma seminis TaxID=512749 RepID=A0ABY9HBH2_9MOLU|nr:hypothetical protein [Mycoplasma seminis]WLP85952.1 hypothetical protein Q8852_02295 [Mycoplasma seminis]